MAIPSALPRKLLTLAFLVRQRAPLAAVSSPFEVLLGEKKRGVGIGKWNGFGGKVEPSDASIVAAAAREIQEEANVSVLASDLEPRGVLTFTFEGGKEMMVRALARKVTAVED
jgi:8-oxo-dGTP pyrophosphatase MutT (NUDIX family)